MSLQDCGGVEQVLEKIDAKGIILHEVARDVERRMEKIVVHKGGIC